jgi:ubiquinone/menaquinone biosynthesis C-methylase UbiE
LPAYDRSVYFMDDPAEAQRLADKVDAPLWSQRYYAPHINGTCSVLSVGCGPGHFLDAIATQHPSASVTGVDISAARVAEARQRVSRHGNVVVEQADIHNLPMPADQFDFIESRFLFEYLKDKSAALSELVRVCKPNGVICVQDLDGQLVFHYPEDARIQGVQQIIAYLERTGFDVFVGRKLFSLARNAGLANISVQIEPYHLVAGRIGDVEFDLWRRKLAIAESVIAQACGHDRARELIAGFLDYLQDESTLTFSMLFTVIGRKAANIQGEGEA